MQMRGPTPVMPSPRFGLPSSKDATRTTGASFPTMTPAGPSVQMTPNS